MCMHVDGIGFLISYMILCHWYGGESVVGLPLDWGALRARSWFVVWGRRMHAPDTCRPAGRLWVHDVIMTSITRRRHQSDGRTRARIRSDYAYIPRDPFPRSVLVRHARFPRDLLAPSSRGCHEDATRKTASVEFKLYRVSSDITACMRTAHRRRPTVCMVYCSLCLLARRTALSRPTAWRCSWSRMKSDIKLIVTARHGCNAHA